jgi:hypothetical protein
MNAKLLAKIFKVIATGGLLGVALAAYLLHTHFNPGFLVASLVFMAVGSIIEFFND